MNPLGAAARFADAKYPRYRTPFDLTENGNEIRRGNPRLYAVASADGGAPCKRGNPHRRVRRRGITTDTDYGRANPNRLDVRPRIEKIVEDNADGIIADVGETEAEAQDEPSIVSNP